MTIRNMIRIIALSMGLLSAVTVTGFAQAPPTPAPTTRLDARWTPYLGCWRLLQDNVRQAYVPVSDVMIVCVAPSGTDAGVTMTTLAAGRLILEQKIAADGVGHPVAEADCQGTQTSEWSRDGARVFTTATIQCSGRARREVSGVTLMARGASWVDIQATEVDGESQVRVRRYQRTDTVPAGVVQLPAELTWRAIAEAQATSAETMNLEDVIEASKHVSAAALEAALDETGARFALNSRTLKQLADAGVSPNVIDLMVAQSFPQHFRVERAAASPAPPAPASASVGGTTVIYSGVPASMPYPYYDPYYSYYSYYSPFAYPYWGNGYYYNNNRYYFNRYYSNRYYSNRAPGTTVIIQNDGSGPAVASPQPSQPPRVVNGRGYTRVSPGSTTSASDDATPAPRATSTPQGARKASGKDSSSSSSSDSSSSSSSDSSGSRSGNSNGGSVDTGRTAQPR